MKKYLLFVIFVAASLFASAAEPRGNGMADQLSGAKIIKETGVERKDGALVFNGRDSILALKLPKVPSSFTVVADIVLPEFPEKEGVLFSRPGFHNMLSVEPSGRLRFTIFGADKKTLRVVRSENTLTPKVRSRIAAVVEELASDETRLILYINGAEEGRATLRGPVYPYGDTLNVGAAVPTGEYAFPLAFRLENFRIFDRVLDGRQTFAL